jgi:ribonuclease P protein component
MSNSTAYTFNKSERLKSRKTIASLFQKDKSKSFGAFPLRLVWIETEQADLSITDKFQAAFSVPKKIFRRANVRNTIRRRVREAYRLHKHRLAASGSDKQYAFMWIYTSKEIADYQTIEKAMQFAIRRFMKEISSDPSLK